MRPAFLIMVGIGLRCRLAEARGLADQRLVELLPEGRRPHEGLVVEAGAEERRQQLLTAPRSKSSEGQRFWLAPPALNSSTIVARVFGSGGAARRSVTSAFGSSGRPSEDAARAVIFEAAADQLTPLASSAEASVSPAKPA
jgi:hypothetical protein